MWVLESGLGLEADFDDHLNEILKTLRAKADEIKGLPEPSLVELFVGIGIEDGQASVTVEPSALALLGELGVDLVFDLYAPQGEEE